MTTEALAIPAEDLASADAELADLRRKLAVLDVLADAATEIALVIKGQAVAMKRLPGEIVRQEEVDAAQVLSLAFERACRAVRMCFMLQDRLKEEHAARIKRAAAKAASEAFDAKWDRAAKAKTHKARAVAVVRQVATSQNVEPYKLERLTKEAREYLDQDHIIGDVLNRPMSELIAMICDMAGLSPDWAKLAQEAWAKDEVASGAPGERLTNHPPTPNNPCHPGSPEGAIRDPGDWARDGPQPLGPGSPAR